jgi:hypothetical protein
MGCGFCGKTGHNRRTCQAYNEEQIAEQIASGVSKQSIFRSMDCAAPGFGVACELVDRAWSFFGDAKAMQSETKNERVRGALGMILGSD